MLHEQEPSYSSRWAALQSIAGKIGCSAETLRKWVDRAEADSGIKGGMTTSDLEELKTLRRENRELKRANEILKTASAFFAQAELDRRLK
jgi:transposase-like protein